jgi:hypothetical protein
MPREDIIWVERTQRNPGERAESPSVDGAGKSRVFARLDVLASEWDDPTLLVEIAIETSINFGEWQHSGGGVFQGGSRDRNGGLPHIGIAQTDQQGQPVPFGPGVRVRYTYVVNKRARVGLVGETE